MVYMKTTAYFDFRRKFPDRVWIKDEWILSVVHRPARCLCQEDGRLKLWGKIDEAGGRWLRVVLLPDGITVHNAFFDRAGGEEK